MLYYLVQARPIEKLLPELRQRLDSGEIEVIHPFGPVLHYSLEHARLQENGLAIWEEADYSQSVAGLIRKFRALSSRRADLHAQLPSGWLHLVLCKWRIRETSRCAH
jgi:hypothetical protein